jgi:hypothetical protein
LTLVRFHFPDDRYTCTYEVWSDEEGRMVHCGKAAVGKLGRDGYLCEEHMGYVRGNLGIPFADVKQVANPV